MINLYITEKPSVARAMALVKGVEKKSKHFIECKDGSVITWLYGHVLELYEASDYDPKLKEWRLEDLPIIPNPFKIKLSADKKVAGKSEDNDYKRQQALAIQKLLKKAKKCVLCSDGDAEGEVLAREVVEFFEYSGPVFRIIPTSLELTDLREIMRVETPIDKTWNLYQGGLARSHIDWLIGINITRALTIYNRSFINSVMNAGRVQTAIISILYQNHIARANFKPQKTFSPELFLDIKGESVKFRIQLNENEKEALDPKKIEYSEPIAKKAVEQILSSLSGKSATITSFNEGLKSTPPPIGFKLTDLQVYLSNNHGVNSAETLKAAQNLYDNSFLTYPRTDNGYMPESAHQHGATIISNIAVTFGWVEDELQVDSSVKRKIWDSSKFDNHHAIMPTKKSVVLSSLTETERLVYKVVCLRYLMQFAPDFSYFKTEIDAEIQNRNIKASGNVTKDLGWKTFQDKNSEKSSNDGEVQTSIPKVEKGDVYKILKTGEKIGKTTKPSLYTEGSLISTLTAPYKLIDDDELKAILKKREKGIGKQSTTSAILTAMKYNGFYKLDKNNFALTKKGIAMAEIAPKMLLDISLTAKLELALDQIEKGKIEYETILENYKKRIQKIIQDVKSGKSKIKTPLIRVEKCLKCEGTISRRQNSQKKHYWICGSCKETFKDVYGVPKEKGPKSKCVMTNCPNGIMSQFEYKQSNGIKAWICTTCEHTSYDDNNKPSEKVHSCEKCKSPLKYVYSSKNKKTFWICRKNDCGTIYNDEDKSPVSLEDSKPIIFKHPCPKCGGVIMKRRKNNFWGCKNWNVDDIKCKAYYPDKDGEPEGFEASSTSSAGTGGSPSITRTKPTI